MNLEKCPLCNSSGCTITRISDWNFMDSVECASRVNCQNGFEFIVHDSVNYGDSIEIKKRYNAIFSILLRTPYKMISGFKYTYKIFYEESSIGNPIEELDKINIANNMKDYPSNFADRIDKILLNLSLKYKDFGEGIYSDIIDCHLLYCESNNIDDEVKGIYRFLKDLNFVNEVHQNVYIISANGWEIINEIQRREKEIQQGFIAMAFIDETESIGEIFQKVIKNKCGYIPCRIDQKEHNNQIVPEILFEISRSKFVVVDVTIPNYGAYYEAGYAEASGKQVIVCCREDVFNSKDKPHFDIAQKSTVVWKDEADLEKRLYRRIEATVGLNL